jgi:D-aminopeptidase
MIGLLKTYALQGLGIALLLSLAFGGIQTARLSAAKAEVRELAAVGAALARANMSNQAVIAQLKRANVEWSAKCKADLAETANAIEQLKAMAGDLQFELAEAKRKRQVIYKESKDACHNQPVPSGIRERLNGSGS